MLFQIDDAYSSELFSCFNISIVCCFITLHYIHVHYTDCVISDFSFIVLSMHKIFATGQ